MRSRVPLPLRMARGLLALVVLTACGRGDAGDDAERAPTRATAFSVRDSGGVRIVRAGFATRDTGTALRVLDTLLHGARTEHEGVVGLTGVQPLSDSSLVVYSASGPALLRYGLDGGAPLVIGRAGAGSSDAGSRAVLLPYLPDTLLLWDMESLRLMRVTVEGIGDAVAVGDSSSRLATVSGVLRDGSIIGATIVAPASQQPGLSRAPAALLRFSADGRFVDTLVRFRGPERVVQVGRGGGDADEARVRAQSVPFGRATLWTVGRESVLLLDTETCHVERRDAEGALRLRLDFACTVEAVSAQDREQFLAEVLATARSRADSSVRRRFVDEATFPPAKATASGLLTDAWDRIWVRLPVRGATDDWRWQVYDADGAPLATLQLARAWRIAAVRGADLLAVDSERDDAPPVVARLALPEALHRAP
jgi:hypothetical protein